MNKNYFAFLLMSCLLVLPVSAQESIFSNSDSEQFKLEPLNYPTTSSRSSSIQNVSTQGTKIKAADLELSNKNYASAISNLNNAQIELREQLASYTALMAQAKTNYEAKRDEYKSYKKEYNALKKKMNTIEKTKKLIQANITTPDSAY